MSDQHAKAGKLSRQRFYIRVDSMTPDPDEVYAAMRLQKYLNAVLDRPEIQREIRMALEFAHEEPQA